MPQPNASSAFIELDGVFLSRPIGLGGPFVRRKRVEVFWGLDLELPRRGLVLVTGGPGAGKTCLLLLLCGAVKPDTGRLVVDGVEPWTLSRRKRKRAFGNNLYLGQNPALWHLAERVGELGEGALRESAALVGAIGEDEVIAGLDHWRRLTLALGARAALNPAALLLDDPLAALDEYRGLFEEFPESPWAPRAAYAVCYIYRYNFADTTAALDAAALLLDRYPDSEAVDWVKSWESELGGAP